MRIREVNTLIGKYVDQLTDLHTKCFPSDEMPDFTKGYWWVVYDGYTQVGFCGLVIVPSWDDTGYLSRGGVVSTHRGRGLQRKMINVRIKKARKIGWDRLISATRENIPSSNNLMKCGFTLYQPKQEWLDGHSLYWIKKL